jgi:hypothetical protein
MIGPAKLANKAYSASVVLMNSAHKTSVRIKQAKPYYFYLNSCREKKFGIVQCSMIVTSEAENFPFTVKISSVEKKMKKQHAVFYIIKECKS